MRYDNSKNTQIITNTILYYFVMNKVISLKTIICWYVYGLFMRYDNIKINTKINKYLNQSNILPIQFFLSFLLN